MRIWPIVMILAVAACTPDYPMDKAGTWSLDKNGGSNEANLRAMIVNPHDLVAGQGETTSVAHEAAPPVKRLFAGKRYPLPASDVIQLNVSGGEQQPQQAGSTP